GAVAGWAGRADKPKTNKEGGHTQRQQRHAAYPKDEESLFCQHIKKRSAFPPKNKDMKRPGTGAAPCWHQRVKGLENVDAFLLSLLSRCFQQGYRTDVEQSIPLRQKGARHIFAEG